MSWSDSSLSSLTSAPSTDDEAVEAETKPSIGIERYFKIASNTENQNKRKSPTPPSPVRAFSPPHEYVLADNPDIAFIVMFRARFSEAFPKSLPHLGPQDIERDITDITPGEHVERLLCVLIGLCLNRKKDVERGHYQRALEEVIQTHSSQWPRAWEGTSPLQGGRTFVSMSPEEKLTLLRALILWSLSSSDAIQAIIKQSYRRTRHEHDITQPLSVQPWGKDSQDRRYWLIEGRDDTHFRLYREGNPGSPKKTTWWSVAGTIDELRAVADSLSQRNLNARRLSERIHASIPRFEASEEKRKRRDYRLARKAAFARPEPGFSLYEGRTRGKKMKYTYPDDEDSIYGVAGGSTHRSTRNRQSSPIERGPVYTASGRQVKARQGGMYGEILSSSRGNDRGSSVITGTGDENELASNGRSIRGGPVEAAQRNIAYQSDEWNSERVDINGSDGSGSRDEWKMDDNERDDADDDGATGEGGDGSEEEDAPQSLIVHLQYRKTGQQSAAANGSPALETNDQNGLKSSFPPIAAATNGDSVPLASTHDTPVHNGPMPVIIERPPQEEKLKESAPSSEETKPHLPSSVNPHERDAQLGDIKLPTEEQKSIANGHSGVE